MVSRQNQPPKSIAPEVLVAFERYHWPGNVRELENVVRRALVVAKGDAILVSDLPVEMVASSETTALAPPGQAGCRLPIDLADLSAVARILFGWARKDSQLKVIPAVERELIINALAETGGNQVQAAKLLGITRATLRKRIDKFDIKQELSIH